MATGGFFGVEGIRHFNGGLFDDDSVLARPGRHADPAPCDALDWSTIEPSIFGTLFERSLTPQNARSWARTTPATTISCLIVEPVLMAPLRREWEAIKAQAVELKVGEQKPPKGRRTHKALTRFRSS